MSSFDGKESSTARPIPISNPIHSQSSEESQQCSSFTSSRSRSHSSNPTSAWFDSNNNRKLHLSRNLNNSNASKRRSLIIHPLWAESGGKDKEEQEEARGIPSLPQIEWNKYTDFKASTLSTPIEELLRVSSGASIEDACKQLLELASTPTSSRDFLIVTDDGEESNCKTIFDHTTLNCFLSLVLSPTAPSRSPSNPRSRPSTPASDSSSVPLQSPSIQASAWSFPIQQAPVEKRPVSTSSGKEEARSVEEVEREILRLAKKEEEISVSLCLALASGRNSTATVSSEAGLEEILRLLSGGHRRLLVEEKTAGGGKASVLTDSAIIGYLLQHAAQDPDLSLIFETPLEDLTVINERVLEISGEKTVLEAMQLLSLENCSSLAVFDVRGTLISAINVNEISLSILRSSSKTLLSTTLSSFISRNLAADPEGTEGKEMNPVLRLGTSSSLGRATASLLATKSVAAYLFENEDEAQGLTPPTSATSASSSSFKELGFLQDLNYALPSLAGAGATPISLGKSSGGSWNRPSSTQSQMRSHSPSSSFGSSTSTNRSGSQSQHPSHRMGASTTGTESHRIPLARRSSSASYQAGLGSFELPPPSPSKLSLALGNPSNTSSLKGLITLQEVCQLFSRISSSNSEEE